MGTPFDFLSYHGSKIPALLPCTLFIKEENTLNDLLFSFAFPFINNDECLVIYFNHPVWLGNNRDPSLIHNLFDEITNYFQELGKVILVMESQIEHMTTTYAVETGSPHSAYPTSLTHFSYDVSKLSNFTPPLKESLDQLQEAGFKEYSRLLCYECEIETLLSNLHISDQKLPYEILKDLKDKNITISLEDINPSDLVVKNYSFANQFTFISSQYTFELGDHGVIGFHNKQFVGFFQWTPNLFELPKNTLPIPFLYPDLIRTHQFTTGKIFRFGMKIKDSDLFKGLFHKTALTMREKGVNTCQIGYIDEQNDFLTSLLDQIGFRVIHSLQILKKEV